MNIAISGGKLSGTVEAIASKSCAHRLLICAALADAPCVVEVSKTSEDIKATVRCLSALGARIERIPEGYRVEPIDRTQTREAVLDCGESASTMRFLLPVSAILGRGSRIRFEGSARLAERPNTPLVHAMRLHGVKVSDDHLPITVERNIEDGMYMLPGNVSSQFITGLMFVLPLLGRRSFIRFSTDVESGSYIALTIDALRLFGVTVKKVLGGYEIPGDQIYHSPGRVCAEGDWSNAAFWMAARALGSDVSVTNLNMKSVQGDRAAMRVLDSMRSVDGSLRATRVDASDIPDLVPVLAVVATQAKGETVFYNAGRLRIKECDRLAAMCDCLSKLGADIEETADGLIVRGGRMLHGAQVESFNDHRIAMSMAIAATVAEGEIVIRQAEAVAKSYPDFYEDYKMLGGCVRVCD